MASFTDKAPTFNPYVQQQPVEAMVQVGTFKQQQYDQNLQSIQTTMNRVAGLNIARDVDKQYLKSKMSEVTSKLQTFAAGDFSSANLTRSMSGMIAEVGGDEIVQNAVFSTQNYQNQLKKIQASEKDGTLTPDNLYNFQKQASPWLNGTTPGETFNGQYTEHFDVLKYTREVFDDIKPDGYTYDQIYKLGADGNPITDKNGRPILSEHMTRLEKEGRMPEKVQQTINQIFSEPRVSKQLGITGEYNYRDYNDQTLMAMKDARRDVEMERYAGMLDQLTAQKAFASEEEKANIDIQMDAIKDASAQTYDVYSKVSDPDAIRAMIYTDNVRNNYTKMFSNVSTSTKVMDNPAFRIKFDMQKEANDQSRWAQQFSYTKERDAVKDSQWLADYKIKAAKQLAKEKEAAAGKFITGGEKTMESNVYDPIIAHNVQFEAAKINYDKATNNLIYETLLTNRASEVDRLVKQGVSKEDAISQVIENTAQSRGMSKEEYIATNLLEVEKIANNKSQGQRSKNPLIADLYKQYKDAKDENIFQKQVDDSAREVLESNLPAGLQTIGENLEPVSYKTLKGETYTLTPEDQLDLAIFRKAAKMSLFSKISPSEREKTIIVEGDAAEQRLAKRGKLYFIKNTPKYTGFGIHVTTVAEKQKQELDELLGEDYEAAIKKKSDYLRSVMVKNPNVVRGITTGKTETDNATLATLKRMAGEYVNNENSTSPTMEEFFSVIAEAKVLKDLSIGQSQIIDAQGNSQPSIVIHKGDKALEMPINVEQANTLGLDLNVYASPEVGKVMTKIAINKGSGATTNKPLGAIETYTGDDAEFTFDTEYFPQLAGQGNYDARMNIKEAGGRYYAYIYLRKYDANAGITYQTVESVQSSPSLQTVLDTAKNIVNTTTIDAAVKPLQNKQQ